MLVKILQIQHNLLDISKKSQPSQNNLSLINGYSKM